MYAHFAFLVSDRAEHVIDGGAAPTVRKPQHSESCHA